MRAEIIAVGSEMLTPERVDTNSLFITEHLNAVGVDVAAKSVVADDRVVLARTVQLALERADLVIVTGGLGPTADDVTRDAVADALDLPLAEDENIVARLEERFARRGLPMPASNRRQAQVLRGAEVLENPKGTAPGLLLEREGRLLVLLPGPPREMKPMLERLIEQRFRAAGGSAAIYRRVLKTTGRPESQIDEAVQPIYKRWLVAPLPITTTILATPGQIEIHLALRADDPEAARQALDRATEEVAAVLGSTLFAADGRRLEEVVGDLLRARQARVATAESCTGGLLCSRLTDVPGSSDYVERGVVCYSNRAKTDLLGVPEAMIRQHGAVSEPVAVAMAQGIRERSGTDIGVGVTGVAGPGGGTPEKPVGTVVVALASPADHRVRTLWFPGDREQVKYHSSQAALDMIRRYLLEAVR